MQEADIQPRIKKKYYKDIIKFAKEKIIDFLNPKHLESWPYAELKEFRKHCVDNLTDSRIFKLSEDYILEELEKVL